MRYLPGEPSLASSQEAGHHAQSAQTPPAKSRLLPWRFFWLCFLLLSYSVETPGYAHINQTGQVTPAQWVPERQPGSSLWLHADVRSRPRVTPASRRDQLGISLPAIAGLPPGCRSVPSSGPEHLLTETGPPSQSLLLLHRHIWGRRELFIWPSIKTPKSSLFLSRIKCCVL